MGRIKTKVHHLKEALKDYDDNLEIQISVFVSDNETESRWIEFENVNIDFDYVDDGILPVLIYQEKDSKNEKL